MTAGIVGYGIYVPKLRIKVSEIERVWQKSSGGIGVNEKAVASIDEDACTLAVEAARRGIEDFSIDPKRINAIYVGSESHPYAVNPTSSIVGDALGTTNKYYAVDMEFACKAGTAGMQVCYALKKARMIDIGLAIGSDTAQSKPNDALEFTAASGAAAFFIGDKKDEVIAEIESTCSYTSDMPDFWRRPKAEFPEHTGRFTAEAYFKHVIGAAKMILEETGYRADEFDYAVFHQPNGKFPLKAASILGIETKKVEQGLITPLIGNTYSGSTMIGLASILDIAKPKQKILAVSYGSGAGSDAFIINTTDNISDRRAKVPVLEMIKEKEYIDYALYLRHRRKIKSL
ncbi:MAG: hydroxymethylglutaryl-CoA synthase [Candidatus Diapherotrites archaeon]|nr:hydroxymethylglutaryl-CoA synthase [Candidatus Diapherotrites archaeon]